MSYSYEELSSWDLFFYYGKNDIQLEMNGDLTLLAIQPYRSLYYNARESGGISGYENHPNEMGLQINIRFNLANAVAWKNSLIADGANGLPDRRIAVSQSSIHFSSKGDELDIAILFIPYYNFNNYETVNIPMAGIQ